jgi:fumarate hydratase class I
MMNSRMALLEPLVELIRRAATDLPADVELALQDACAAEAPGSPAVLALNSILENVRLARSHSIPMCQDTGTPIFFVQHPEGWSTNGLKETIRGAIAEATHRSLLRPNAMDALTCVNNGDNLGGEFFPFIHFQENSGKNLRVQLLLKGGGSENVGAQYALPDERLRAERSLEGVRRAALDAVRRAQGFGCPPGVLGVAIGGDRASGYLASKQVFLRRLGEPNPDPRLAALEDQILAQSNLLGIGPMGFGGRRTLLGVHITALHRLPASYFVTVSYMCWAYRRWGMDWQDGEAVYA